MIKLLNELRFVHRSKPWRLFTIVLKSLAWTAKNPDEAVGILLKSYPQATAKSERLKWNSAYDAMLTVTTLQHGLGYMSEAKVKYTRDAILSGLGKNPCAVAVKDLYTNEFLPKRAL